MAINQCVKLGGCDISLAQEIANARNERGTKRKIVFDSSTELAYLQAEVLLNVNLINFQLG